MVANRDHHQAGVALGFQVKFLIEDRKINPFDRHGVEAHRRYAQQEIADVEIHLLRHPLIVILQLFAVHIGKESATLVVSGFCVRGGETAIGLFLIHDALQPGVVHRGFRAEHHHVRGVKNFTFVEHVGTAGGFRHAGFPFIGAGDDKVPRLGVGARRAVLQQRFQLFRFPGSQLFRGVKGLGGIALQSDRYDIHNSSSQFTAPYRCVQERKSTAKIAK